MTAIQIMARTSSISKASRISKFSLFAFFSMLFLAACTSDNDYTPTHEQGFITFGQVKKASSIEWENGRTNATRDADSDVASTIPDDIGVFAFGDGQNTTYIFNNQRAIYKESKEYDSSLPWDYEEFILDGNGVPTAAKTDNLWPYTTVTGSYTPRPWEKMRYRFFAYSPWSPDDHVTVSAENYAGFNSFTWDNIPGFSDKDYVLANTLVDVDNSDGEHKTEDAVHFEMRHILSRIRFFFKMSPRYRNIRKIEIDTLTVLSAGKVKTATFNFNNNSSWDGTVHWSNEQIGDADPVNLISMYGPTYEVKTDYPRDPETNELLPFNSVYVYPQEEFKELKMRLSYTVYDSKGVPTRRNAKVVNTIEIKGPEGKGWNLLSGYYYDIYVSISPAYLYVLSDEDQDFDGWVIINDDSTP